MLEECKTPIGSIFTAIAAHHLPTTLFHCHAGKDRTGIIAALLLSLAGVDDDAIAQDYALTGEYLTERTERERARAGAMGEAMTRFDILFASTEQSMRISLGHLRERHGDTQTYLRACGVSDAHIKVLREMLIGDFA
jgi:protein-tyrosine phosphatase